MARTSTCSSCVSRRAGAPSVSTIWRDEDDIVWGNQILSYVFHVKGRRTHAAFGDVRQVLDGELQPFIEVPLGWKFEESGQGTRPIRYTHAERLGTCDDRQRASHRRDSEIA